MKYKLQSIFLLNLNVKHIYECKSHHCKPSMLFFPREGSRSSGIISSVLLVPACSTPGSLSALILIDAQLIFRAVDLLFFYFVGDVNFALYISAPFYNHTTLMNGDI